FIMTQRASRPTLFPYTTLFRSGIHWRTAKKYADQTDWNTSVTKRKSRSPVMGPFMEIVDTWLEEDRLLPRKQRHTGVRIFQRLKSEEHTSELQSRENLVCRLLL